MAAVEETGVVAPREGRWIARPRKPQWLLPASVLMLVPTFINCLHSVFRANLANGWVTYLTALLIAIVLLVFAAIFVEDRFLSSREDRQGASAMPDGVVADEFTVEITIVANGRRLGSDRGIVWFAEGLMGFSGSATSFVLADWAFELIRAQRRATMSEHAVPAGALLLIDAPVPAYILVRVLGRGTAAFTRRLRRFERESAAGNAERSWPPLTSYSESPSIETVVRS